MFDFIVELAPGVQGYTVDTDHGLYVPLIESTEERQGNVGRYLDSLPTDRRVVVPNVINGLLADMLHRRGFILVEEWSEQMEEMVPCWERKPDVAVDV
jgi:hypothetical protein